MKENKLKWIEVQVWAIPWPLQETLWSHRISHKQQPKQIRICATDVTLPKIKIGPFPVTIKIICRLYIYICTYTRACTRTHISTLKYSVFVYTFLQRFSWASSAKSLLPLFASRWEPVEEPVCGGLHGSIIFARLAGMQMSLIRPWNTVSSSEMNPKSINSAKE